MTLSTILAALKRAFGCDHNTTVMSHVPVQKAKKKRDWRERAMTAAALKYGKPFRCAGSGFHREVMLKPGEFTTIKGGQSAADARKPEATVTKIARTTQGVGK